MSNGKRIYLDNCCLNRPFDDQNSDRIRMESEAVLIIVKWAQNDKIHLLASDISLFEIQKTPNFVRKTQLKGYIRYFKEIIKINDKIRKRAEELKKFGFKSFDALHISSSEYGFIDSFLTTDDNIVMIYNRFKNKINVKIQNPLTWVEENL